MTERNQGKPQNDSEYMSTGNTPVERTQAEWRRRGTSVPSNDDLIFLRDISAEIKRLENSESTDQKKLK